MEKGSRPIAVCPFLPAGEKWSTAASMAVWREDRGAEFYVAALGCAQSLWRQGKPAQAILQLNRAWSADLRGDEPVFDEWEPPYRALVWMLRHAAAGFLGNPVRHFQHLATRMNEVRREPRVWRAWACFHLARQWLDPMEYPPDESQLANEAIRIPEVREVTEGLGRCGWRSEAGCFEKARG